MLSAVSYLTRVEIFQVAIWLGRGHFRSPPKFGPGMFVSDNLDAVFVPATQC